MPKAAGAGGERSHTPPATFSAAGELTPFLGARAWPASEVDGGKRPGMGSFDTPAAGACLLCDCLHVVWSVGNVPCMPMTSVCAPEVSAVLEVLSSRRAVQNRCAQNVTGVQTTRNGATRRNSESVALPSNGPKLCQPNKRSKRLSRS